MEINLEGLIVIVGNYGSGKTEVSINLAVKRRRDGLEVRVADLDLVNPYFRTREAKDQLADLGIEVALPPEKYLHADLPILSPIISGIIRQPGELTILDVGGDDAGATVLSALADSLENQQIEMLQVVNPFRPFTDTIDGCIKMREMIEQASKLTITGIIGNANLIDETTTDEIYRGYDFVKTLSEKTGLSLHFITATPELLAAMDGSKFDCPVLPIERQLVPPWKKPVSFGQV